MIVLDFIKLDYQGRINLSDYLTAGAKVLFFVDSEEFGTMRVRELSENEKLHGKIASVDSKGRVIIPTSFRKFFDIKDGTCFEVGYDEEKAEVMLKFSP